MGCAFWVDEVPCMMVLGGKAWGLLYEWEIWGNGGVGDVAYLSRRSMFQALKAMVGAGAAWRRGDGVVSCKGSLELESCWWLWVVTWQ